MTPAGPEPDLKSGSPCHSRQQAAPCPHCGRLLKIPAGKGDIGIGCKGCRHVFHYNRDTGKFQVLGSIRPQTSSTAKIGLVRNLAILLSLFLLIGLLGYAYYQRNLVKNNPQDTIPQNDLETIRKELKAIAE